MESSQRPPEVRAHVLPAIFERDRDVAAPRREIRLHRVSQDFRRRSKRETKRRHLLRRLGAKKRSQSVVRPRIHLAQVSQPRTERLPAE